MSKDPIVGRIGETEGKTEGPREGGKRENKEGGRREGNDRRYLKITPETLRFLFSAPGTELLRIPHCLNICKFYDTLSIILPPSRFYVTLILP